MNRDPVGRSRCASRLPHILTRTLTHMLSCMLAVSTMLGVVRTAAAALPDKTLVFCSEGSPAGFDPAQYTTSVEFSASAYTVYNRLVEFQQGGTKVEPGLAERWDISPDGLTYTFHL